MMFVSNATEFLRNANLSQNDFPTPPVPKMATAGEVAIRRVAQLRPSHSLDRSSLPGLKKSSGAGRIDGSMGRRALSTSNIGPDTVIDARNSGATPIDAPLRVDGEHSVSWDDHCDVLVVGFGAAGASAAIEAAGAGADVIVTDRFGGGGASAKSGGVVYAGGGTRFQKTAGYDDSPDAMTSTCAWKSAMRSLPRRCATSVTAASR